jgi:hypothetical protein
MSDVKFTGHARIILVPKVPLGTHVAKLRVSAAGDWCFEDTKQSFGACVPKGTLGTSVGTDTCV